MTMGKELIADLEAFVKIDVDKTVALFGLKNCSKLNGQLGIVTGLEVSPGRHAVQVNGDVISVKSENLKVHDETFDPELDLACAYTELAKQLHFRKKISDAEYYYEKALSYFSKIDQSEVFITFMCEYLGFVTTEFVGVGNIKRLFDYYLKLIDGTTCTAPIVKKRNALHLICEYYLYVAHDFKTAIEYCMLALEICDDHEPDKPAIFFSLADAHQRMKDFDTALRYSVSALVLAKKQGAYDQVILSFQSLYKHLRSPHAKIEKRVDAELAKETKALKSRPKISRNHQMLIKSMLLELRCEFCGERSGTLQLCSECKQHQSQDWARHKPECTDFEIL